MGDAWSLGATAFELVTLEPLMAKRFLQQNRDSRRFLRWLGQSHGPWLPTILQEYDPTIADLLGAWVASRDVRESVLDGLVHEYISTEITTEPQSSNNYSMM